MIYAYTISIIYIRVYNAYIYLKCIWQVLLYNISVQMCNEADPLWMYMCCAHKISVCVCVVEVIFERNWLAEKNKLISNWNCWKWIYIYIYIYHTCYHIRASINVTLEYTQNYTCTYMHSIHCKYHWLVIQWIVDVCVYVRPALLYNSYI